MLLSLSACGTPSAPGKFQPISKVPADLQVCFKDLDLPYKGETINSKIAVELILILDKSEKKKTRCGRRLLNWIAEHRHAFE